MISLFFSATTKHVTYMMHVCHPLQQLQEVKLDEAVGDLQPGVLQEPTKIVIHVRKNKEGFEIA